MEAQAPKPASQNTPFNVAQDHARTATPLSASNASSIHSSPNAHSIASRPDSESLKQSLMNQPNSYEAPSSDEITTKKIETMTPSNATPALVAKGIAPSSAIDSIGTGKRSSLMSKWLPSSTSALAEPLEEEATLQEAAGQLIKNGGVATDGMMTPPFTPLKRVEPYKDAKTPQHPQMRALDKLYPRGMFMTPPSTIKHDQRNLSKPGSPYSGLSPALRLSGHTSDAGSSPNQHDPYHSSSQMESLSQQMMNLSSAESHRPRSLSSPMEAGFEPNNNVMLNQLFVPKSDPPTGPRVGLSSEEEVAEFRKRADTFCSTSSTFQSLISDITSSPASSLINQQINEGLSNNYSRASQSPFRASPVNRLSGVASQFPFSKSGSYSSLPSSRPQDSASLLFTPPRHARDFPSQAAKLNSASSASSAAGHERHQRYHTAPVDNSPLSQGDHTQVHVAGKGDFATVTPELVRRTEERSMSVAAPSAAEILQSKLANSRFRPRSSTMADTTGKKMLGKSYLSSELTEEHAEELDKPDSRSATNGQIGNSARSPVASINYFSWPNAFPNPDFSAFPGPFNVYPTSLTRPSTWSAPSSAISARRYCQVLGVPPKLMGSVKGIVRVRNAFAAYGDLMDIYVDTLSPIGFILVGFHDTRSNVHMIQNGAKALETTFGSYLKLEPMQRSDVIQLTQDPDNLVLSSNEGILVLSFDDPRGIITEEVLVEYLQRYGDLKGLRMLGPARWLVEWYDDRSATAAQKELLARDFADFQVTAEVPEPGSYLNASTSTSSIPFLPSTIRPPPMVNPMEQYNNSLLYRYAGDSYPANYMFPWNQPFSVLPPTPLYNSRVSASMPVDHLGCGTAATMPSDVFGSALQHLDRQAHLQPSPVNRPRAFPFPGVPPSNVMDLDRIECGSDPRTTCMIKNIPNKITDEMLFNFINEVCPRGFDFLYLRMDFKARLNVGYAFINFLSVENVLKFAKAKLGLKWGVFLSEKTVQMCYASIQGKENLIEKFRNSAIMEEEESFRPKVYYSSGPSIGLPEPFPHANDLQRKARSQANAALLVRPPNSTVNPHQ